MDITSLIIIVVAGFLLGIIGAIIGSTLLILVPLLNFLGLPIHVALGTAKVSVIGRELIPIYHFNKNKLINYKTVIPFIIAGIITSYLGTNLIISLNENIVKTIVAVFMIIISLLFLSNPNIGMKEKKIKIGKTTLLLLSVVAGALIGFYQGIFGGGANVFIIFAFILLFGNTFLKGVANSKIPNLIFSLVSLIVFIMGGFIDWVFAIPLLIATSAGSHFGAKLAIKKGNKFIRLLFVLLVIGMAIKLLFF